jgi:hypothetical protein
MTQRITALACVLLIAATAAALHDSTKVVEKETKTSFESVLHGADGGHLVLTGAGCRKKTAFNAKVYAIAHWIDAKAAADALSSWKGRSAKDLVGDQSFYDAMVAADVEKRIRLVFVRKVKGKQVREGFDDSLPDTPQAKQFLAMFQANLKDGDVLDIHWLPGGTIEVHEKGKRVGAIEKNPTFAQDAWKMYFNKKVVDGHLETVKKELISNVAALWDE